MIVEVIGIIAVGAVSYTLGRMSRNDDLTIHKFNKVIFNIFDRYENDPKSFALMAEVVKKHKHKLGVANAHRE